MPYDVSGWVEVSRGDVIERGRDEWCGTLCLDPFILSGDAVSERLFGLAKVTRSRAPFALRGTPQHCSPALQDSLARNAEWTRKYGEGDHGHTWALWSELKPRLAELDPADSEDSEWLPVFAVVGELENAGFPPKDIRFVIWGNW